MNFDRGILIKTMNAYLHILASILPDSELANLALTNSEIQLLLDNELEKRKRIEFYHRQKGHQENIRGIVFSHDNTTFATWDWNTIYLWNIEGGRYLYKIIGPEIIHNVRFSPDGKLLLIGEETPRLGFHYVRLWNLITKESESIHFCPGQCVDFSADGQYLLGKTKYNIKESVVVENFSTYFSFFEQLYCSNLSPDKKRMVLCLQANSKIWMVIIETETATIISTFPVPSGLPVYSACFSSDGSFLIYVDSLGMISVRNFLTNFEIHYAGPNPSAYQLTMSPDDQFAIIAPGNKLYISNPQSTGDFIHTLTLKNECEIQRVMFSPDGRHLACSSDKTFYLWDSSSPDPRKWKILYQRPFISEGIGDAQSPPNEDQMDEKCVPKVPDFFRQEFDHE